MPEKYCPRPGVALPEVKMGFAAWKNVRARKSSIHFELGVARKNIGHARFCIKQSWKQHRACPIFCWGVTHVSQPPSLAPAQTAAGGRGSGESRQGASLRGLGATGGSQGDFSWGPRGNLQSLGDPRRWGLRAESVRLGWVMRWPPVRFNGAPGAALSRARMAPLLGVPLELSRGPPGGLWRAPRARPGALRGGIQGVGISAVPLGRAPERLL